MFMAPAQAQPLQIFRASDFEVIRPPLDQARRLPRPLDGRSLVGNRHLSHQRLSQRPLQRTEPEHLRRIGLPDLAAVDGVRHPPIGTGTFEGVAHRHGQQPADRISRQLSQYRAFLEDGGEIYFKTDDDDLFRDSLEYFPASGYEITWKTFDLHENEPAWNIRTEHEGMFTEMGIKIKALIARKLPGDETVTWIEPKVLKKMAAAEAAAAEAAAHGETADA